MVVALVALAFSTVIAARALSQMGWDATLFVGFGGDAPATREYGEERLGTVFLREHQGHDGKFFFIQANDPWLLDPEENAEILAPPVYRSQRMMYPLLAGGFGLLRPEAIVWGLLLVNLGAMALGTLATAKLSQRFGRSPWWGLAFAGNLGFLYVLTSDGAGILAACLAMWAMVMVYDRHTVAAIAFLSAAALTREVMLVCAVGLAVWLWTEERRREALRVALIPAASIGVWLIYLLARLGPDETSVGAFGWPFVGLIRAIPHWTEEPIAMGAGVCVVMILVIYTHRWLALGTPLAWAYVGFVPLGIVFTERVWAAVFDYTRAFAPLITAAVILIFVEARPANSKRLRTPRRARTDAVHSLGAHLE